jgi:hypothetical protein
MALGAFSQVLWPGVGDIDECWIIATYWALVATGVTSREDLPSIKQFRAAAERPDRPGSTGGSNRNLMLALKRLLPRADAVKYDGGREGFTRMLKKGYVASLSVRSWSLPKAYQFGYRGNHQVSVFYKSGKYFIMNPLQVEGSALMEINYNNLVFAANGLLGDRLMHAVFIKAGTQARKVVQKKQIPRQPRALQHVIPDPHYIKPYASATFYDERRHQGSYVIPSGE